MEKLKDTHIFLTEESEKNLRMLKAVSGLNYKTILNLLLTDKIEDIKKMFDISF